MNYFLMGLIVSLITFLVLLVRGRFISGIICSVIGTFAYWLLFYLVTPNTGYPLWGLPGVLALLGFVVVGLIEIAVTSWGEQDDVPWTAIPVGIAFVIWLIFGWAVNWNMFNADEMAKLIGPMPDPVHWTQNLQPLNPQHIRLFKRDNALELAKSSIGQEGSIGSQYKLGVDNYTIQIYKKEIWAITPLDFQSQTTWNNTKVVKHISLVNGEDQSQNPQISLLPEGHYLRYTPGAYYEFNLERHLRAHGYSGVDFVKTGLQLDDDGIPWWVITTAKPAVGFTTFRLGKILLVNPTDGSITEYNVGQQPEWVDMIIPDDILKDNLSLWGEWRHGWWNAFGTLSGIGIGGAMKDLLKAGNPNVIFGQSGDLELVVNLTSNTDTDSSLVYLAYCNGRTGEIRLVETQGGKVDEKIISVVNSHPQVGTYKMHGSSLQHTNVHGIFSAIVPLFSESHMYNGVAIVDVINAQQVGVGQTLAQALNAYDLALSAPSQQGVVSNADNLQVVNGVVELFQAEVSMGNTTYFLKLKGQPFLFAGNTGVSELLRVTREGQTVSVQYVDDGKDIVPIKSFQNLSVLLRSTIPQDELKSKVEERRTDTEAKKQANK